MDGEGCTLLMGKRFLILVGNVKANTVLLYSSKEMGIHKKEKIRRLADKLRTLRPRQDLNMLQVHEVK